MASSGTNSAAPARRAGHAVRPMLAFLWTIASVVVAQAQERLPARPGMAVATRFSGLSELTPRNIRGLMPLSSLPVAVRPADDATVAGQRGAARATRLGSLAGADERLREFVSWRAALNPGVARDAGGAHGTGVTVSLVAAPAATGQPGALAAWDASHARVVWAAAAEPADAKSGALVTAGGLILYCRADGWFTVLDVASGRELWKHQLAGGERGTPISYLGSDGHQYVAVLTEAHGDKATLQPFSLPR